MVENLQTVMEEWEPMFRAAAIRMFEEDRRAILSLVQEHVKKSLRLRKAATTSWSGLGTSITKYLEEEGGDRWRETFVPILTGLVDDVGLTWKTRFGTQFSLRHLLAEEWFQDYALEFATPINETTSSQIHGILAQAQAEGWTSQTTQRRLGQVFDTWMTGTVDPDMLSWLKERTPEHRVEMIARTETTRLANAGSQALFKNWEVEKKEWRTSIDGRERESHGYANGQIVEMDEPFIVGGYEMMYPGDTSQGADASEVINCRCTVLPVIDDPADLKPMDPEAPLPNVVTQIPTYLSPDEHPQELSATRQRTFVSRSRRYLEEQQNTNPDGVAAVNTYTGSMYAEWNKYLRTGEIRAGNPVTAEQYDQLTAQVRSTMRPLRDQLAGDDKTMVAYRGLTYRHLFGDTPVDSLVGTGFTERALMSTTIDDAVANNFSQGSVLIKLELDGDVEGVYVASVSSISSEKEFLVAPGTSWVITEVGETVTQRNRDGSVRTTVPTLTVRRARRD